MSSAATDYTPSRGIARDELSHQLLSLCAHTNRITRTSSNRTMLDDRRASLKIEWTLTSLDAFGLIDWVGAGPGWDIAGVTELGEMVLQRWEQQLFGGDR